MWGGLAMRCFGLTRLPGTRIALGFLFAVTMCPQIWTQQSSRPMLHSRSQQEPDETIPAGPSSQEPVGQPSTLPDDVWGTYEFDHSSDSIEIDLNRNKISGYITRLGDAETDSNTPLTFFFDESGLDGAEISFQTRVVHGVWYSFRGTIVRGDGKTRADEGYYMLHGVLALHHPQSGRDKSADETIESRNVNFKSVPQ